MMNPVIASLSELTKMFAELFRVAFLFPAMVFTLLNGLFILPHFDFLPLVQEVTRYDRSNKILIGSLFALLLGYIMNAVEDPIVQLFKGKIWKETWFGTLLTAMQEKRKEAKGKDIQPYYFPSSKSSGILPTTLGNIIAAYEDYPEQTYNMNADEFWPRIHPFLVKNNLPNVQLLKKMPDSWGASCSISVSKPYSQGARHGSGQFHCRCFSDRLQPI